MKTLLLPWDTTNTQQYCFNLDDIAVISSPLYGASPPGAGPIGFTPSNGTVIPYFAPSDYLQNIIFQMILAFQQNSDATYLDVAAQLPLSFLGFIAPIPSPPNNPSGVIQLAYGTGFNAGTTLSFDGNQVPVTVINGGILLFNEPIADLWDMNPMMGTITVYNQANPNGVSATASYQHL